MTRPRKICRKRDSNPVSFAPEADALTTRPARRCAQGEPTELSCRSVVLGNETSNIWSGGGGGRGVWWLLSERLSNMLVYLRDESALAVVHYYYYYYYYYISSSSNSSSIISLLLLLSLFTLRLNNCVINCTVDLLRG